MKKYKTHWRETAQDKEIFKIQSCRCKSLQFKSLLKYAANIKNNLLILRDYLLVSILLFFCFASPGYALDVTLKWAPNSEPNLAGYKVFFREEGQSYNYNTPYWETTEPTCTIYDLDETKTYYFVVRAFDTKGKESKNSNEVRFEERTTPKNLPPIADAGPDSTSVASHLPMTFDGSGSYDPDGDIVAYDWDFGNGVTDSGITTSCSFDKLGSHTVTLTVTDDRGATDTDTIEINVYSGDWLKWSPLFRSKKNR